MAEPLAYIADTGITYTVTADLVDPRRLGEYVAGLPSNAQAEVLAGFACSVVDLQLTYIADAIAQGNATVTVLDTLAQLVNLTDKETRHPRRDHG